MKLAGFLLHPCAFDRIYAQPRVLVLDKTLSRALHTLKAAYRFRFRLSPCEGLCFSFSLHLSPSESDDSDSEDSLDDDDDEEEEEEAEEDESDWTPVGSSICTLSAISAISALSFCKTNKCQTNDILLTVEIMV